MGEGGSARGLRERRCVGAGEAAKLGRMSPPLLFVVIVAYKSRDEIGACLASLPRELVLADGTRGAVEAVVVDNSPGDGTGEVVRREFPWVTYVAAETNLGFGRANNVGFEQARRRGVACVLFLNPDTVSNAAALVRCVERVQADGRIGLISPKLVLADGTMDAACRRSIPTLWDGLCRASGLAARWPRVKFFAGYNLTWRPDDGTYDVGAVNGAFMLGRTDVLEEIAVPVRGADGAERRAVFDESFFMYGDDLDLCIRVARAGWRIVYDGSVAITHLKGVSVAKDFSAMSRAIFDANRDVYLKHFATPGVGERGRLGAIVARWKYVAMFGAWKWFALARGKLRGHRRVKPV